MQSSSKVYLSNQLDKLTEILIENLYLKSAPFEKRTIIIPSAELKNHLLVEIAKSKLKIAAAIKLQTLNETLSQALRHSGKRIPTRVSLSLSLQHEIKSYISACKKGTKEKPADFKQLIKYLDSSACPMRLFTLCDHLSELFHKYGEFGSNFLDSWLKENGWQQDLWISLFSDKSPWTYPYKDLLNLPQTRVNYFLWGFNFLPKVYLHYFSKANASFYFFSPSKDYLGDLFSDRAKAYIKRKTKKKNSKQFQWDFFENSSQELNPLLANLAKIGKKFYESLDDLNLDLQEYYDENDRDKCTALQALQKDLLANQIDKTFRIASSDDSLLLIENTSRWQEIEVLRDRLIDLMGKNDQIIPADVLVLAPDINEYVPYIHGVFGSKSSLFGYSISTLEMGSQSNLKNAFNLLLSLPEKLFSSDCMMQFFSLIEVMDKFGWKKSDLEKMQLWIKQANIRIGIDAEQQTQSVGMHSDLQTCYLGTWEMGIDRLSLGFAKIDEETKIALQAVGFTDIELFNEWVSLIYSLKEDLKYLYDGSRLSICSWLEYFSALIESYFAVDEQNEFIQELKRLSISMEDFSEELFDFKSISFVIEQIFSQKKSHFQTAVLHGIKFSSLGFGSLYPAKIIYLLGMQENAHPRKENSRALISSLFEKNADFYPSKAEEDRYLFLQLIHNAKNHLIISFQKLDPLTQKNLEPSFIVQELFSFIFRNYSPSDEKQFFQNLNPFSFASFDFHSANYSKQEEKRPLIPEFYFPTTIKILKENCPPYVEIKSLKKLASNPLNFYFQEVLKIFFPKDQQRQDFTIPKYLRRHLLKEGLKLSAKDVLKNAELRGEFPSNTFKNMDRMQLEEEMEQFKNVLTSWNLQSKDLFSIEFQIACKKPQQLSDHKYIFPPLEVGNTKIIGTLEDITPKGMICFGENSGANVFKFWPLYLIYLNAQNESKLWLSQILFPEEEEMKEIQIENPQEALKDFIDYFILSINQASPLLPQWSEIFLKKTSIELEKAIEQVYSTHSFGNEILHYLVARDQKFNASVLFQNYATILREKFQIFINHILDA